MGCCKAYCTEFVGTSSDLVSARFAICLRAPPFPNVILSRGAGQCDKKVLCEGLGFNCLMPEIRFFALPSSRSFPLHSTRSLAPHLYVAHSIPNYVYPILYSLTTIVHSQIIKLIIQSDFLSKFIHLPQSNMPLQSIPSPAGFTRRRPRIATALAIAFLLPRIKGSSEEFTSTGPNLDRIMEVEAVEIHQKVDYEGLLSWEPRGSRLRRRAELNEFEDSPNLVARQVVAGSSAVPTTTSAISPTASAVSPTGSIPTITPSSTTSDPSATSTSSLSSSSSAPSSSSTAVPAGYELPQPFE